MMELRKTIPAQKPLTQDHCTNTYSKLIKKNVFSGEKNTETT